MARQKDQSAAPPLRRRSDPRARLTTSGRNSLTYDTPLKIQRIDSRQADVRQALAELRERLSPRGNVVSEAGRQRTIEVFGEPLSAGQVVERICHDVQTRGLAAVLDYSARLDGPSSRPQTLPRAGRGLAAAHRAADPEFLATVRRIRDRHPGISDAPSCTATSRSSGPTAAG